MSTIRRRDFLNKLGLGCAGIGATSLLSGITNLGLINSASAANANMPLTTPFMNDYKALVCVFLGGGADSWNFLIPSGQDEYAEYAAARGIHAIAQNELLPINPITSDGKSYGLHHNFPKIQQLFEDGNLAFVSNTGPLIQRSTQGISLMRQKDYILIVIKLSIGIQPCMIEQGVLVGEDESQISYPLKMKILPFL